LQSLHAQSLTQIKNVFACWKYSKLKSGQLLLFSNILFLFTKCAPFLLKIGKDFNIDDWKGKMTWIDDFFFITHLSTFGLKVILTLKFMDFENVPFIKVFHIYVIEGIYAEDTWYKINFYLYVKCNAKWGTPKYKIYSYKPTQKWHVSCVLVLGKGLLVWDP